MDDFLIDSLKNVRLELQHPQPQEIALVCDQPWEGNTCIYFRIIPDGGRFRMWYMGSRWNLEPEDPKHPTPSHPYFICYAESEDGIHWTKPDLGLFEFQGSKKNNICVTEIYDNFTPFKDANPQCPPEAKYKAIGQSKDGLVAWRSPDGIHWKRLGEKPIITKGTFDSQNVAFWDPETRKYRAYIRDFHRMTPESLAKTSDLNRSIRVPAWGVRDIRLATSGDFVTWSTPELLNIAPSLPSEAHYINCIARYDRAPHFFLGFPARYVERGWSPSMRALPDLAHRELRAKAEERIGTALTDCVFMSSRDGFNFHRWQEAFMLPGPERFGTWVYGDCYPAYGLIETKSRLPGASKEFSLFFPEEYWMRTTKMRRYTLRIDGFVAASSPLEGGELLTKPFQFAGKRLSLNFATSAAGRMHVEVTDAAAKPLPGFTLHESDETFGDSLDRTITWKGNSDISSLAGRPIRLR
ncbi:MAG: hypothetical protein HUU20_20600, partial [Pirellulales bacterium]|nr:hypothetical protein [Pirellulales bacterium]